MKFVIRHEIRGRVRAHFYQKEVSIRQADLLCYYLCTLPGVKAVRVYERIADAAVMYEGSHGEILEGIQGFSYDNERVRELVPKNSGGALNREYKERPIQKVVAQAFTKSFPPPPVLAVYAAVRSIRYPLRGIRYLLRGKLEAGALSATAIAVSALRRDSDMAGSVMLLLGIGELLEEWTHKKSVSDLARSMPLNTSGVWQKVDGAEVLVPVSKIREGDLVTVHMENVTSLDGVVTSGDATMNQASMIGGSAPVREEEGSCVYAGIAVEGGEITLWVRKVANDTWFERIVTMIEESEQLRFTIEDRVTTLADALVPWSPGGTVLTWLLTRNVTKALSIPMMGFSCALKLAIPLFVLSAVREAGSYHITVKGGKYMEAVAAAHTIVFDETGTLIKARPQVVDVVVLNGTKKDEPLRIAACLEEHFPHSMADAAVHGAVKHGLIHKEMHSRVDYTVAHGTATYVDHERAVIGSYHFVLEDEGCRIPRDKKEVFNRLPVGYSHPYLTIGGSLAAVICIEDPLRGEADGVVTVLHRQGIAKIVMMTGDSERTAATIAGCVGVDEYYSEVLPGDKVRFVDEEKRRGRRVIMINDGINDSSAPSVADAGIAISEGAEIAREIADITTSEDNPFQLVTLRTISWGLMDRTDRNYRSVIGFNLGLILLGVGSAIIPATSAMLHNTSTLAINLKSMINLLDRFLEARKGKI